MTSIKGCSLRSNDVANGYTNAIFSMNDQRVAAIKRDKHND